MGRKLLRVPIGFDWPPNKTWAGYLNPFYKARADCGACDGSGYAPDAKRFKDEWYGNAPFRPKAYGSKLFKIDHSSIRAMAERNIDRSPGRSGPGTTRSVEVDVEAWRLVNHFNSSWSHHLIQADVDALLAEGRLMDFTHVPRNEEQAAISRAKVEAGGNSWLPGPNGYVPTAAEVNDWSLSGFGHDGINQSVCVRARCEREGVIVICPKCGGDGESWPSEAHKALAEAWQDIPPPEGEGFQLWETTSEGSPVSPVFADIESLCEWAAENATTFGSYKASASEWRAMLGKGLVMHREGNNVFL